MHKESIVFSAQLQPNQEDIIIGIGIMLFGMEGQMPIDVTSPQVPLVIIIKPIKHIYTFMIMQVMVVIIIKHL